MPPARKAQRYPGWVEHARAVLSRSGHRSGEARAAVIELLGQQRCCLSAQEIFDALRHASRPVGFATVYRVLDLLWQRGLVQRVDLGGVARYEPALASGEHHHHLVCEDCGKVEPFADAPLERALERVGGGLEYEIGAHDVVLRGSCSDCR
jgi:Fur family transcriptional regulator, ferric uptake regulator